MTHPLAGKRVLIVEDDNILAMNLVEELAAEGAKAIGPAGTVDGALKAIKNADWMVRSSTSTWGGTRLSRSPMLWLTATFHSSSRQGTWSQVTYRFATQTCRASKNLPRPVPFVQRSKPQCRPHQAKNRSSVTQCVLQPRIP
jgi:hypothetical protein